MPGDIAVEIRNLEETQREMERIVQELHGEPMLNAMRTATLLVQRDARIFAPVDTGRLRASIVPEVRVQGKDVMGVVGSNVFYAPYMEFGTGAFGKGGSHFPPPSALDVWARRHGLPNGFVVARAIWRRGGLKGRKYLQRAFEQNKGRIQQLIGSAVAKIIRK